MVVAISFTRQFFGQDTYVIICDNLNDAFNELARVNGFADCVWIHHKMTAIFFGNDDCDSNDMVVEVKSVEVLR